MTPGARIQAAIELIVEIEAARGAADDIVGGHFRKHRFIGSKDRAAISEHIYAVLRRRAALDWYIERVGAGPISPRKRVFAALMLVEGWAATAILHECDGDRFRPDPLGIAEQALVKALDGKQIEHPDMPRPVRCNYPEWLDPALGQLFGDRVAQEMSAMNGSAPLDLRVNQL